MDSLLLWIGADPWLLVYDLDDGDSRKISIEQAICSRNLDFLTKAKIDAKKG
jgi:hypothetical protein